MSHDDSHGGTRGEWEIIETTEINKKHDIDTTYGRACASIEDHAFHGGWMTPKEVEEHFKFFMQETYEQYMNDVA